MMRAAAVCPRTPASRLAPEGREARPLEKLLEHRTDRQDLLITFRELRERVLIPDQVRAVHGRVRRRVAVVVVLRRRRRRQRQERSKDLRRDGGERSEIAEATEDRSEVG